MSWAAHEFEDYFIQRHVGLRASFLAIALGSFGPDLFTKWFVYASDDPAQFQRGWPGVGFTHSLLFGIVIAVVFLATTRSQGWALGVLIGLWAHSITDVADSAGVMLFFPFSTEPISLGMWKYGAAAGRYGDAAAYYSSLAAFWDLFWLAMTLVFASRVLRRSYFRDVIVPADPRAWEWIGRTFRLPESALFLLYRGILFYGVGRMCSWFLYARLIAKTPLQPVWDGPRYLVGTDLSDASFVEVALRSAVGAVLFAAFVWAAWHLVIRRLWNRAADASPVVPPRPAPPLFSRSVPRTP